MGSERGEGAMSWRIDVLCEDRRTERFVTRLCERFAVRVLHVHIAPSGKGAAESWVRKQLPAHVKKLRSKNYQAQLGLWVVVDADKAGVTGRTSELHAELSAQAVDLSAVGDRVAILIPAWSIETWLASLNGVEELSEETSYKDPSGLVHGDGLASALRGLWGREALATTVARAVAAWKQGEPQLTSLRVAYAETAKFGA